MVRCFLLPPEVRSPQFEDYIMSDERTANDELEKICKETKKLRCSPIIWLEETRKTTIREKNKLRGI
jgi:hypothetical protein